VTIPGLRSTLRDDLYVVLVDWQPISAIGATFRVFNNPLVNWLWIGTVIFLLGMLVSAWPDKEPVKQNTSSRIVHSPGSIEKMGKGKEER